MQWKKGDVGEAIMDDVYNSNPTAVKAVTTSFGQAWSKMVGAELLS